MGLIAKPNTTAMLWGEQERHGAKMKDAIRTCMNGSAIRFKVEDK